MKGLIDNRSKLNIIQPLVMLIVFDEILFDFLLGEGVVWFVLLFRFEFLFLLFADVIEDEVDNKSFRYINLLPIKRTHHLPTLPINPNNTLFTKRMATLQSNRLFKYIHTYCTF